MAKSSKANDLKAKEAKQKKILAGLLLLLVVIAVVQVPKLMKRGSASSAAPPPAATTPAAVPAPASGAAPAGSLAPPDVSAAGSAAPAPSSGLADTTVAPPAADGQLVRFDLFSTKDPFVQQVDDVMASQTAAGSPQPAGSGSDAAAPEKGEGSGEAPSTPSGPLAGPFAPEDGGGSSGEPAAPETAVARISVDGTSEEVVSGRDFPAAAPVFHLESATAAAAKVSIAGGSYQDGSATITLTRGKSVTLQNTYDGTRYVLVYHGSKKVPTSSLPPEPTPPPATTAPGATTPPSPAPTATTTTTTSSTTTTGAATKP